MKIGHGLTIGYEDTKEPPVIAEALRRQYERRRAELKKIVSSLPITVLFK